MERRPMVLPPEVLSLGEILPPMENRHLANLRTYLSHALEKGKNAHPGRHSAGYDMTTEAAVLFVEVDLLIQREYG